MASDSAESRDGAASIDPAELTERVKQMRARYDEFRGRL